MIDEYNEKNSKTHAQEGEYSVYEFQDIFRR